MSIVSAAPIGRARRRGRFTDKYVSEYVQPWRVRTNSATDDGGVVIQQGLSGGWFPSMYSPFSTDPNALLSEITAQEQQASDPQCWLLDLRYSSLAADPLTQNVDPLDELAEWGADIERVEIAMPFDLSLPPQTFTNSAGTPFDPPRTRPLPILVISYADKVANADVGGIPNYLDNSNSVPFLNQAPDKVYLSVYKFARSFKNNTVFFRRTLNFKILPDFDDTYQGSGLWSQEYRLDVGYFYLKGGKPAYPPGGPPPKPLFLDGKGGLLNGTGLLQPGQTPIKLQFTVCYQADFNELFLQVPPQQVDTLPLDDATDEEDDIQQFLNDPANLLD